ncbi:MAG: Slp family lipoprotein [Deferrisomatales bacterium]
MAVPVPRVFMVLLLATAPVLVGWTHPLSRSAFFSVNPHVSYSQVRADPEAFVGTTLMLAGRVEAHRRGAQGTELEILCYSRNRDDRPVARDEECGSFLARTGVLLDPEGFARERLVTLTGVVRGSEVRAVEGTPYAYPVFEVGEIHLWPLPREPRPRPRYRDPYWDPFWDPWCDPFHRRYDPWRRCRYRW